MEDSFKPKGRITVYKVKANGERCLVFDKSNTVHVNMYTAVRQSLLSRSNDMSIDYMCWGSYSADAGTFIDGTFAGTGASGTTTSGAGLIQSTVGSITSRFVGTFPFLATKQINYFQMGRGYGSLGASSIVSTPYFYDNSLNTGSTYVTYLNGETLIVDWSVTIGA